MPGPPSTITWKSIEELDNIENDSNSNWNSTEIASKSEDIEAQMAQELKNNSEAHGDASELKEKEFEGATGEEWVVAGIGSPLLAIPIFNIPSICMWCHVASKQGEKSRKEKECKELKEECEKAYQEYKETEAFKKIGVSLDSLNKELSKLKEKEKDYPQFNKYKYDFNHKRIMLIGPTKWGKSTLGNRLLGYNGDIDSLCDYDDNQGKAFIGDFKVADKYNIHSETNKLECKMKMVNMENNSEFLLSVIDTPGAFDTNGKTDEYSHEMLTYGQQCGGVNMFIIVYKHGSAFDANYQNLLKIYENFWGKQFWKHCIVVVTNRDLTGNESSNQMNRINNGMNKVMKDIRDFLTKCGINKEYADNMTILTIGENNYENTIIKILSLFFENDTFKYEYKCENIRFPIDNTWDQVLYVIDQAQKTKEYRDFMQLRNKYLQYT